MMTTMTVILWWNLETESNSFSWDIPVVFLESQNIYVKFSQTQVVFDYILPIYFVILYNTMGMSHLKVMNASQGCIHKYENLKRKNYRIAMQIFILTDIVFKNK